MKTNSKYDVKVWCRGPKCKYHPDKKIVVTKTTLLRCYSCKKFVAQDHYEE